MMTKYALGKQADHLMTLFAFAEIEINGQRKTMNLTKTREGNKVRFSIEVPASEVGTITRRIIKDSSGQVVWDDTVNIVKPDTDLKFVIPIEPTWKGGGTT
jgi:hypothetical protein